MPTTIAIPAGTSTYTLSASSTVASLAAGLTRSGSNPSEGVVLSGSSDTLLNSGTMSGAKNIGGQNLYAPGVLDYGTGNTIVNLSGGYIHGGVGGIAAPFGANNLVIVNAGIIDSYIEGGIFGNASGLSVTNQSGGTIGAGIWVSPTGGSAGIVNSGLIFGHPNRAYYGGVYLGAGGSVTNLSGGTIRAGNTATYGIEINGAGTVSNAGTIIGSSGVVDSAVILSGAVGNRLIVDPGAVFTYGVNGGNAASSVLELASGATTGTIAGLGSSYINFNTVTIDSSAKWFVGVTASKAANYTFDGFNPTDTIDVTGFTATSLSTLSGGLGVVLNSGASHTTLHFGASISSFGFTTGAFGTDITTVCFCKGTQILTPAGEVGVESLTVGDLVVTKGSAEPRKITWIGKGQVLATRGQRGPATPVIVRKGALADNVPNRDLHVTKAHSLYFDGVFIPAEFLVNHHSIV